MKTERLRELLGAAVIDSGTVANLMDLAAARDSADRTDVDAAKIARRLYESACDIRNNAEALLARLESAERFIARLDEEIRRTAGGLPESWHHWQHTTYEQMRDWYFAAHDKDSR